MALCYVILEHCYFEDVDAEESVYCVTTRNEDYAKEMVNKLNKENNGFSFRYLQAELEH